MENSEEKDGTLVSVSFEDGFEVSLGNNIQIAKTREIFPVNAMRMSGKELELITAARTKSSFFLLPFLPGNRRAYLWDTKLVNVFLNMFEEPCIELLYRFHGGKEFLQFEEVLRGLDMHVGTVETSPTSVMHRFAIRPGDLNDLMCFINGTYSKMSAKHKQRILTFHGSTPEDDLGQILWKASERRARLQEALGCSLPEDAELHSLPDMAKETFDPKIYRI